ncbi:nuclease-related domain-containing protein [Streptomyces sp. NPDC048636]|uniref:nuclease-related domain-containing protein n=1 Tax=Streptomyces sp. NPDC048636 TaxID=3155762 RepID=UPI0034466684
MLGAWAVRALRTPRHVTAWRTGAAGERRTADMLQPLERRGGHVLHDRAIRGSRANLDHVATGNRGIAYIDTRNWQARHASVSVSREGDILWYGRYPQNRSLTTVERQAPQLAIALRRDGWDIDVQPVIAVHGAPVGRRGRLVFDGVTVIDAPVSGAA